MLLQENAMLGPYRVTGRIGEGGMGAVYRATDTRLGRNVAIKVLTAVTLSDKERLQRFEQEARATGMLNHPNLLTIFDVGSTEGTPYLVSELLEGETLRDRLDRGSIPPRKAVDIALQVAHGLAAAHEKGIVHRDLKPENIYITKEGRVKILDFGIAKLSPIAGKDGPTFQMAATEPGIVLGTVGYMSPEQIRGELVDRRSDIFAFGAILYEMLTGSRAFKRDSSIETLSAILKEEPQELLELNPNTPPPLEKLVRRCLEKDRDQRFGSARDLAFNLETLSTYSSHGTMSGVPNPVPRTSAQAALPTAATAPPTAAQAPAPTTRTAALTRTRTLAAVKPQPRVSPSLLMLLYIVSIAGAAWGGWYLANRIGSQRPDITFQRMTFRRGEVRGGRFGSDGDTIVYSASWDGQPSEIYVANRHAPEARPVALADADLLAVSRSAELAILLRKDRLSGLGTLARVPVAGGTPREMADQVLQADWMPNSQDLAIIRFDKGKFRVESPISTVLYETPHQIRDIRMAPDGNRIAFFEPHGDKIDLVVLDKRSRTSSPVARGWSHGANGLAWTPSGKEIWVTGTDTSAPPALWAVDVDKSETRLISRLTGSMKLFDISSSGRILLSNGMWRAALEYQAPGDLTERDLSWLDWSMLADLSADGRTILFSEGREGGGSNSSIYLRRADAPTPVKIGDGYGDALSPNGKLVLGHVGSKLVVLPTGSGEARELKIEGAFDTGAVWLPDSRHVILAGALKDKGYALHLLDTLDESESPISPENIFGEAYRPFALSPDGRMVAGMTKDETIALYPISGGASVAVSGTEKGEVPIQWSADGASLFVYRPTAMPAQVYKINLSTGARELWKQFTPIDLAGVYKIAPICMTHDASAYAYDAQRIMSDLYVGEGLR
ncbi:MAG TPA: protein kinase [Thermoanaerobaculia bacterium]|nr:protein kinase [Thermoanaerobaculia bacterium]